MVIRLGTEKDLAEIMKVIDVARTRMRENGNFSQWTNGYPSEQVILEDILAGHCYIGEDDEGETVVSFAFIRGEDPTYKIIENGVWLNDEPYGTIHRIASSGKKKGMLKECIDFCFTLTENIRIDTHADNHIMLSALSKLNFKKCGIIYCRDGSPRLAFQKTK